ncbi:GGDEF domain-containing protein [Alcaligenes sp. SDU_A2]|uniref:GGDEF domain-containing protein n=1 Tax=Alcaligenes sp. SDU_A2 TaxID=3136634 RepID=UPI00311E60E5
MISSPSQYFVLIVPACSALLGIVMLTCWTRLRSHRYLLWISTGYLVTALPLSMHSLLDNTELARWSVPLSALYMGGVMSMAHGVALRFDSRISFALGGLILAATLGILYYFSHVVDNLWVRMYCLNAGLAFIIALPAKAVLFGRKPRIPLASILRGSYIVVLAYAIARVFALAALIPHDPQIELTRSGFWLLMLAVNMFISIWLALTILASTAMSIVQVLDNERSHDPLTRLLNRRAFFEQAPRHLRKLGSPGWAVLVCDIDHFKAINDTWGHATGDQALQAVGELLLRQARQDDLVARFGGEEFVLLIRCADLLTARQTAERLRASLADLYIDGLSTPLTASFGLALLPPDGDLDKAIHQADTLLYQAKHAGRNQVAWARD